MSMPLGYGDLVSFVLYPGVGRTVTYRVSLLRIAEFSSVIKLFMGGLFSDMSLRMVLFARDGTGCLF